MSCTLVILAAGMGSRYGGLKQIDPIGPNGEIVIDYSIYDAIQAGFDEVVFIIRKDIQEAFEEAVLSKWESKIKCRCVFQELDALPAGFSVPEGRTKPWGTGHALLQCLGVVQNNFCVINADDFYGADAFAQVADTLKSMPKEGYNYSMVAFELSKTLSENGTVSRGVCTVDENQKLVSVVETLKIAKEGVGAIAFYEDDTTKSFTGKEPVSMNFWGLSPSYLNELEKRFVAFLNESGTEQKSEFFIPFVVDDMIQEGLASVEVRQTSCQWFGVTYPDDKPAVQAGVKALIATGAYPENLFA